MWLLFEFYLSTDIDNIIIREEVERKYLTAFPEMRGKYSFHLCESADGVGHKTED